ncbi:hypothetical protein [Micromonospora sp. MA102]|uniref:hypothetical protein n=1 Tax=Micromonospora sp. MA102 TaxID=2952755 RepID=UPI0021C70BD9|nr:hypothetical protein [Micromonospora sp. MA102]
MQPDLMWRCRERRMVDGCMAGSRHADFSITMEIYSQVSSRATREALRKLGESLDQ